MKPLSDEQELENIGIDIDIEEFLKDGTVRERPVDIIDEEEYEQDDDDCIF